ncbi:MAG: hypothetical protein EBW86_12575, partial [Rhodobacteraceae bacterium]|nr:hypothetical protein [Paracoccaceae bacterium]
FSLLFLIKFNDTSGVDHLSGPLLGPLSQILRESVRSRRSSDLNFSEQVFEFLKTDIPNGVGQR